MKAALLIPVRNKAPYVRRCLDAAFAQTVPTSIVIFGPPSMDGTDGVIADKLGAPADSLDNNNMLWSCVWGDHKVYWFRTPPNGYEGMNVGMNEDFNWIHRQIDADVCLFCSADDVPAPNRVERVLWAFETFNPSWVVSRQILMREGGEVVGECPAMPDQRAREIGMAEAIRHQIGSSGGFAWAKDLYDKYAPIRHIESNDVVLPVLAMLERGMYYLDEHLQTMYLHDDIDNLGLEGQLRGARSDEEQAQLLEVNNFHNASNWLSILRRINEHHPGRPLAADAVNALYEKVIQSSVGWAEAREQLTMDKIPPRAFGAKALGMVE